MPGESIKPRYQIVRGIRMPLGFPSAAIESSLDYRPSGTEIFVASYPKSGTTWLQYIIYMLVRQQVIAGSETLGAVFPHLEEVGAQRAADQAEPKLIKTHLPFGLAPFCDDARYVVIARNPFDCVVSFFHHTRGFPQHYDFAAGAFEDYFRCFLQGEVDFGNYFEHLAGWYAARERHNVLFLTYESLKADTTAVVGRIARFIADRYAIDTAAEIIDAAVIETGIDSMRRNQRRWSSRRPESASPFVRKGVVGDWQSLVTPAMTSELLAECGKWRADVDFDVLWPEVLAAAGRIAGETNDGR